MRASRCCLLARGAVVFVACYLGSKGNAFSQTPEVRSIVQKARELFKDHGLDPHTVIGYPLDLSRDDPWLISVAWQTVREDLEKLIGKELDTEGPFLPLFLIERRYCVKYRAKLGLLRPFARRFHQGQSLSEYRFVFEKPRDLRVDAILRQLFEIDDDYIVELSFSVHEEVIVGVREIRQEYFSNGEIDVEKVGAALSRFPLESGPVQNFSISWTPIVKTRQYAYLRSGWKASGMRSGQKTDIFWSLKLGVKKDAALKESWAVFAKIEIGVRPSGERGEEQIRTLNDPASEQTWADMISFRIEKNRIPVMRPVFVPGAARGTPLNSPLNPTDYSSLHRLSQAALQQVLDRLCVRQVTKDR